MKKFRTESIFLFNIYCILSHRTLIKASKIARLMTLGLFEPIPHSVDRIQYFISIRNELFENCTNFFLFTSLLLCLCGTLGSRHKKSYRTREKKNEEQQEWL